MRAYADEIEMFKDISRVCTVEDATRERQGAGIPLYEVNGREGFRCESRGGVETDHVRDNAPVPAGELAISAPDVEQRVAAARPQQQSEYPLAHTRREDGIADDRIVEVRRWIIVYRLFAV
jgi:hypothetical protein